MNNEKTKKLIGCIFYALILISSSVVWSAENTEIELEEIENYLEEEEKKSTPSLDEEEFNEKSEKSKDKKKDRLKNLTDLANLAPFSDVAVIQRRYLSRTQRFEAFLGATALMNESFFNNYGGVGKIGYYFSEKWGIEGTLFALSSKEKQVTKSLTTRSIQTEALVTPKSFYGLDLKWVPIYGKMAFFNERIVPFDLYFSLGGGLTQTNQLGVSNSATTIKLGTGQMFAITKGAAFRWDFSWHFFQADNSNSGVSNASGTANNLFLLLGFSFFFPESQYR